jgi:predicted dehydrogenase
LIRLRQHSERDIYRATSRNLSSPKFILLDALSNIYTTITIITMTKNTTSSGTATTASTQSTILDDASFLKAPPKQDFKSPPRVLIIGAGSRGTSYAQAALSCSNATIVAVAEPNEYKRNLFGSKFIWPTVGVPQFGQCFTDWREWVKYERGRQESLKTGKGLTGVGGFAPIIVDAVFVCVLDEMHEEVVCGIAGLGVSICVEKPLATRLESCVRMYRALRNGGTECATECADGEEEKKETVFGICHVLRYSPHNMMLRHLVLDKEAIGDVLSIEHVEPVGWWHFSHSYVR